MKKFSFLKILTLSVLASTFSFCSAAHSPVTREIINVLQEAAKKMPFLKTEEAANQWLTDPSRTGDEIVSALVKTLKVVDEVERIMQIYAEKITPPELKGVVIVAIERRGPMAQIEKKVFKELRKNQPGFPALYFDSLILLPRASKILT